MKNKTKEAYALLKKATRAFSKAHSTKADFVRNCSDETTDFVNRCFTRKMWGNLCQEGEVFL